MPDIEINAIRERVNAAQKYRPWKATWVEEWNEYMVTFEDETTDGPIEVPLSKANAELMARSVTDIPALLDALEAMTNRAELAELDRAASCAEVARLQGELDAQEDQFGVKYADDEYGPDFWAVNPEASEYAARFEARSESGAVVMSRKVGPWLPVPTDGAEN